MLFYKMWVAGYNWTSQCSEVQCNRLVQWNREAVLPCYCKWQRFARLLPESCRGCAGPSEYIWEATTDGGRRLLILSRSNSRVFLLSWYEEWLSRTVQTNAFARFQSKRRRASIWSCIPCIAGHQVPPGKPTEIYLNVRPKKEIYFNERGFSWWTVKW